jgi:trigger factor
VWRNILKIEKQLLDDHQMQLTVEVDPDQLETSKRRAARQLARRGKIPGFRPGKAPYDVVVRHYGEPAVLEQAMDNLVDDVYPKVLEESEIKPAAAGILDKIESLDPPTLIFRVPLAPEIDLGKYRSVRIPYKWSAPGKKEHEDALIELQQMYATTESVERAVEMGDYVLVDVLGERENPKNDEDRSAALNRSGYALVVREDAKEDEWPYPGFSKELVGLKAEESKTITYRYPKNDDDEALRGESVKFNATIKSVRAMTLPELNDELAKMTGQYDTLDQLKEALAKDLETRSKAQYDDEYNIQLIDKIKEGAVIKYPPQMIEHEAEHVLENLQQRLSQQGLDLDTYFKMRQTSREKFLEEEARPVAINRLESSLILDQLAKDEKIEVDETALQAEFGQTLNELQYQGLDLGKVQGGKRGQKQVAEAVAMESANRLITRRTLERMKAIATGEHKQEDPETKSKPRKSTAQKGTGKAAPKPKKARPKSTKPPAKKAAPKKTDSKSDQ